MLRLLSSLAIVIVSLALGFGALVLATFKSASDPAFWAVLGYCVMMSITLVKTVVIALSEKGGWKMG